MSVRTFIGHARRAALRVRISQMVCVAAARIGALAHDTELVMMPLALLVGVLGGVAVTGMSLIAQLAHVAIFGIPIDVRLSAHASVDAAAALIGPVAGGLLLGAVEWLRRRWKVVGAADPIEANALRGGRMSLRDSLVVSGQTIVSNGCGASVGLEAGYTQLCAGMASLIGRVAKLRRPEMRAMVGCGAAAAIAAAFGAPLTGVFYACELIVGVYSVGSAAPILIAALSAALTAQWLGGAPYSLDAAQVSTISPAQAGVLIALALTVGAVGIGLVRLVTAAERALQRTRLPYWLSPAVGGLCVGGMALITPQVLAAGHGAMVLDLSLDLSAAVLLGLVGLKIAACVISLASGFRGGLFFASLFVGCLIGKLFAVVLQHPLLGLAIDPTVTALAGMACLGVAVVGGPLTMSFLVLELTRNIEVSAWIVVACLVTSTFVRAVFGYSFSTWRLHLRGESIRGADDVGWLRTLTVGRLMRNDLYTVPAGATVAECRREFPLGSFGALFVVDDDRAYCGIVTPTDLFSGDWTAAAGKTPIVGLARHRETVLFRPMNVRAALRSFEQAEAEILVVLDDATRRVPIGFLSESAARRRYGEEMDKAAAYLVGQT